MRRHPKKGSYQAYKKLSDDKIKRILSFSLGIALSVVSAILFAPSLPQSGYANPQDGDIEIGSASISSTIDTTTINQTSNNAIINWQSFNIAASETTRFIQPAGGITLNRINPAHGTTEIYGKLLANSQLILINGAGFYFGPSSYVNVGSIIASTADISNQNFLASNLRFDQTYPHHGTIINHGTIKAAENGLIALMANGVVTSGLIEASTGQVILASGEAFTVGFDASGLINFSIDQQTSTPGIDKDGNLAREGVRNSGTISAPGGKVFMTARAAAGVLDHAINMDGIVEAKTIRQQDGRVILDGGNTGIVKVTGNINATGKNIAEKGGTIKILGHQVAIEEKALVDASGLIRGGTVLIGGNYQGNGPEYNAQYTFLGTEAGIYADAIENGDGGTVIVWSDRTTFFYGNVSAKGGSLYGNGGFVETSSKEYLDATGLVAAAATNGLPGTWLLDPTNVTISTATTNGTYTSGIFTPTAGAATATISAASINSSLNNTNVTINTASTGTGTGSITVNSSIAKTSGNNTRSLTFNASGSVAINSTISYSTGILNFIINAGGAVTQTSPITVAGLTINAGSNPITLTNATNIISGAISITNSGTNDVNIINNSATNLSASTIGQNFTLTSIGAIAQTGALATGGTSNFIAGANSITLNNAANSFGGPVSLSNSGANNVSLTDNGTLVIGTSNIGTGTLTLTAGSTISQIGAIIQAAGAGTVTISASTANTDIFLNTQANNFSGGITIGGTLANIRDLSLRNTNINAALPTNLTSLTSLRSLTLQFDNTAATLPALSLAAGGNLSVTAGGAITQSGALSVPGTSSFNAGANAIMLTQNNSLTGAVSLNNSGANNVSLTTTSALQLATSSIGQNLTINSGALTQSGALTVGGSASFSTGANPITLTKTNAFTSAVSLNNSGLNNISLTNNGALVIGTSNTGTGTLTLTAGSTISQIGAIIQAAGAGTVTISASTANTDIFLNTQANNFSGGITIGGTLANIRDLSLRNTNINAALPTNLTSLTSLRSLTLQFDNTAATLPALSLAAGGNLSVTAGGAITQSGALSVPGTSSFNAGANAIMLTQNNSLTGTVSLNNSGNNNTSLTTSGALQLAASTIGQNLTVNSGTLTQTGVLTVGGASSFSVGTNPITLTQANAFTGAVSLSNSGLNNVALANSGALMLGTLNIGAGTLTLTAGSTISQIGAITQAAGAGTVTILASTANTDILLNTQANNFSGSITFGGTLGNIRDFALRDISATATAPTNLSSLSNLRHFTLQFDNTAVALPTLALTAGGNLTVVVGGAITQTGALTVPGTSSFNAGANAIMLTQNNSLTGAVSLNNSGNNNTSLTTSGALQLAASTIGQNLTVNSGTLTQTGVLTVGGASSFSVGTNPITLTQANAFTGAVSLSNSGLNNVALTNSGALMLGTLNIGTGTLTLTAGSTISQIGAITQAAGAGTVTILASTANTDILLNTQANNFSGGITFGGTLANIRDLSLRNININSALPTNLTSLTSLRSLTLQFDNTAATLPALSLAAGGNLSVTAGGAITQSGALSVPGTSSFNAGANAIMLTQNNSLTGAVSLNNSGNNNTSLTTSGALQLAASTIGQNLTVNSGTLTQTGVLTVGGASSFSVGTNPITLTQANAFTGAVSLSNSGLNNVALTNSGALMLGTLNIGTGTLTLTAGSTISQIGAITQAAGAGTVTISASTANTDIFLNTQANNFSGSITFGGTLGNIRDFALRDISATATAPTNLSSLSNLRHFTLQFDNTAVALPTLALTAGGNLTVVVGGAITQTGALTVPGTSSFNAGANPITLTQSNNLAGAVTLSNSGANNVSLTTSGALQLAASTVGQNLIINSGALTQSDALTVGGTSNFNTGSNPITLTQANNFTGAVSLSNSGNHNIAIINSGALIFGTSSIGSGTLIITSNGSISQAGAISQAASAGTITMSTNAASSDILLNTQANSLSGSITFGGNLANIRDVLLRNTSAVATVPTNLSSLSNLRHLTLQFDNAAVALPTLALTAGGNLAITAGNAITQTGALAVPGASTFNAGSNAITLTQNNNLIGNVTLNNSGANNVSLTTTSALQLAASTIGQDLTINSGILTQSGALTVSGTTSFNVGANSITLAQNNSLNGAVTINNAGANNVALTNNGALQLATSTIGQNLVINSGALTQSGTLTVGGTSSFNVGANPITLTQANNLSGAVSLSNSGNNNVAIINSSALILATTNVGTGALAITAGGAISQTGAITQAPAAGTITLAANTSNSDISLNTQANNLSGNIIFGGALANIRDVALRNINNGAVLPTNIAGLSNLRNFTIIFNNAGINFPTLALTNGGKLTAIAGGAITQTGALAVPGASNFNAGSNAITLIKNNNLIGNVTLNNSGANNVSLTTTSALQLAASSIGQDLTINSEALTQSGALTVGGTSNINSGNNAIILTNTNNSFVGSISFNNSGNNDISLTTSGALTLDTSQIGSGNLTVIANGDINQTGALIEANSAGTFTIGQSGINNNVILDQANNINGAIVFASDNTLNNIQDFYLTNTNIAASIPTNITNLNNLRNLTINFSNPGTSVSLPALTLANNGNLNITAGNIISQAGTLVIPGYTTLNAGSSIDLTTNGVANSLSGSAAITSGTSTSITNTNPLIFANSNIGSQLTAIATSPNAGITQSGALAVAGSSNFIADNNSIILNNSSNNFIGAVSLSNTGNNNIALTNNNALILDTSSIGSGLLNISANGNITQVGPLVQANNAATFTLTQNSPNANIIFDQANNLNGNITFAAGSTLNNIQDFNLKNINAAAALPTNLAALTTLRHLTINFNNTTTNINLPALTLHSGGNISLSTGNNLNQLGILVVPGSTTLNAGTAINFNANNALTGSVSLTSGTSTFITNTQNLILATSIIGTNLTALGADVSQTGALTVGGTTSIDAGSHVIALTNSSNNLSGTVSLNNSGNNAVSLVNNGALILAASSLGSGTLNITASGDISQTGALSQAAGADVFTLTQNLPAANILLDQTNNITGSITFALGATLNNIQDIKLTNTYTSAMLPTNLSSLTALHNLIINFTNAGISFPSSSLSLTGNLSAIAAGAITQNAAIHVGGGSQFITGAFSIILTQRNDFVGAVSLNNSGTNDVSINNSGSLLLDSSSVGGNFTAIINNGGSITQNSALIIGGNAVFTSNFDGSGNIITLTQSNNHFGGNVSLNNTGNNAVSLISNGPLSLATSAVGSGPFYIAANGNITQVGALTQAANANDLIITQNTANSDLILNQANNINGNIVFASGMTLENIRDVNITNINSNAALPSNLTSLVSLRNLTIRFNNAPLILPISELILTHGGNLSVIAGGNISQVISITVPGTANFTTGAYDINLTQNNHFLGPVSFNNSGAHDITINNSGPLILEGSTVGRDLTIIVNDGGAITQTGALLVNGNSSFISIFNGGQNVIDLTQNNNFAGSVSIINSGNNAVSITNNGALILGTSAVETGTVSISANGSITQSGALTQAANAGTLTITQNASISDVILNQANNLSGSILFATGATLNNIRDFSLNNINANANIPSNLLSLTSLRHLTLNFSHPSVSITIPALTLNNGGNLSLTAGAGISQLGALTIPGTTMLSAGTTIDFITNGANNNLIGTISLFSGDNATITNAVPLTLGASNIEAQLNVTTNADGAHIGQAGGLTITGIASFNASNGEVLLNNASNSFANTVLLNNNGNYNVAIRNNGDLILGTTSVGSGNLDITATNSITQTGAITQAINAGNITFTLTAANSDILLSSQPNNFTGNIILGGTLSNIRDIALRNINASASIPTNISSLTNLRHFTLIFDNAGISFPTIYATGNFSILAGGSITQTGTLTVGGASSLSVGANAISLIGNNSFTGPVSLSNTGTNNASLTNSGALQLATSTIGQNLIINSGTLTQNGVLTVGGISLFSVGANSITLSQANNFTGAVSINNSDFNNITLSSKDSLILGTSNIGTGSFNISSGGSITQSGAITQEANAGNIHLSLTSINSDILLSNQANNFSGSIIFDNPVENIRDISLRNINSNATLPINLKDLPNLRDLTLVFDNSGVTLPALTLNGNLLINVNGAITQSDALNITGSANFYAGSNTINLTKANMFADDVILNNSGSNDVTLTNASTLQLGSSSIGSNLIITSGALTQSGALEVGGTANFTTSSNPINLTNSNNVFNGAVSLNNTGMNDIALISSSALVLGTSSIGNGTLSLTVNGDITQTGTITQEDGAGNFIITENASSSNVSLNLANNISSIISFSLGETLINIQDLSLSNTSTRAILPSNLISLTSLRNLSLNFSNASINLPSLSLLDNGNLTITAGGSISQSSALSIPGYVSLNAGTSIDFTTNGAANSFANPVALVSSTNASITNTHSLTLDNSIIGNNLTAVATGNDASILQNGAIVVNGNASFTAGSGTASIDLASNGNNNNFVGTVTLDNSNGSGIISLKNNGTLTLGNTFASMGGIHIIAAGALNVIGTVNTANNGSIKLDSGDTQTISNTISTNGTGAITLSASSNTSDILFNENVSSNSGNIQAIAGHNITLNNGSINTSGNVILTGTTGIISEADSVNTNNITSALLTTVSNNGTLLINNNYITAFNATNNNDGNIILNNTSGSDALLITRIAQNALNASLNITNIGAITTSGVISTKGGNVNINTASPDNNPHPITVNADIITAAPTAGGTIQITVDNPIDVQAALTINAVLNTAPGTGGTFSSSGGVELNASPKLGAGNIILNSTGGLDLILGTINFANNTNLTASRYIVVNGQVTSDPGINIALAGDAGLHGIGGVLIANTGSIVSGGDLDLVGSSLSGLNGLYGTSGIDLSTGIQIQSGASVQAAGTISLSEGAGNSNINISGILKSNGANSVTITPHDSGNINLASNVESTGGAIYFNAPVNITNNATVNSGDGANSTVNFANTVSGYTGYTLTLQNNTNASGTIIFNDNVNLDHLATFAQPYAIVFNGPSNTFTSAITFNNTNGVSLGNGVNIFNFNNGLTSTASVTTLASTINTINAAIVLGTTSLANNSTFNTGTGSISLGALYGPYAITSSSAVNTTIFNGAIGSNSEPLNSININGTTVISNGVGAIYSNNQSYPGVLILNSSTSFFGNNLAFSSINGTSGEQITINTNENSSVTNTIDSSIGNLAINTQNGYTGSLLLLTANYYVGSTILQAGTLIVGNSAALGSGNLIVNGGTIKADSNDISLGNDYTINNNATLGGINSITLNGNGNLNTVLTNTNTGISTLSGAISGTGSITQNSNNTLMLSSNNSYSGTTTLLNGILQVDHNNALGTSTLTLNGGTLQTSVSGTTIANNFNVNANSSISGTQDIILSGNGALNATLTNLNAATTTLSGNISGTSSLILDNASGALVLSGNNSYTGSTNVNNGLLKVLSTGGLGNANSYPNDIIVAQGAELVIDNTTVSTPASLILSGTLTGSGNASWSTGAISLAHDAIIATYNASDIFAINGTINGPYQLTLTGPGSIMLNSSLGNTTPLAALIANASLTNLAINTTQLATTGIQNYYSPVTLGANSITTLATDNANVLFTNTLNGPQGLMVAAGTGNVSFNNAIGTTSALTGLSSIGSGDVTIAAAVGSNSQRLGDILINGLLNLNGGAIYSSGSQTFNGAILLGSDAILDSSSSNISLNSINSVTNTSYSLDLTASSGTTTFNDAIGAINPLNNLSMTNNGTTSDTNITQDITIAGNLTLNTDTTITESAVLNIGGTSTFNAGTTITLNYDNNFTGPVSLSNSGRNDIILKNNGTLILGNINVGTGKLTLNSTGLSQADNTTITQAPGADKLIVNAGYGAINLNNSGNTILGAASLNNSGTFSVAINNSGAISLDASSVGSGTFFITAGGTITQTGAVTQSSEADIITISLTSANSDIILNTQANNLSGNINFSGTLSNIRDVALRNINTNATIPTNLSSLNNLRNLDINFNQTGVSLPIAALSGNLNVIANGAILQTGELVVSGLANFNANSNPINLSQNNSFSGVVTLTNSGNNNVVINNNGALLVGDIHVGTGSLTLNAIGLSQASSTTITQDFGANNFTVNAGAGPIDLTNSGNAFFGAASLYNSGAFSVALNNSGSLNLGASNVGSSTLFITAGGSITQSGAITQAAGAGDIMFAATAASSDILLNTQANNFSGNIGFNGTLSNIRDIAIRNINNHATLGSFDGLSELRHLTLQFDNSAIDLPAITLTHSGNLNIVTGGNITQHSILNIAGTSTLFSGTFDIDLTQDNSFGDSISVINANNAALKSTKALILGNLNVNNNLLLSSNSAITQTSYINAYTLGASATGGITLTGANEVNNFSATNNASGNITLNNTANSLTVTGITQNGDNVRITNTGNLTTTGLVSTNGGNINLVTLSPDNSNRNLTVNNAITSSGGNISLSAANPTGTSTTLFVNGVLNTSSGNNGLLTLSAGVDLNTMPIIGAGNISLNGNGLDLVISRINMPFNTAFAAKRFVIVNDSVTSNAGYALTFIGDQELTGVGGILVSENSSIMSGDSLTLQGSNLSGLNGQYGTSNVDTNASIQIQNGAIIQANGHINLVGGMGNSHINISSPLQATGAQDINITPAGTGQIQLAANLTSNGGSINLNKQVNLLASATINGANIYFNQGVLGANHRLVLNGNSDINNIFSLTGTALFNTLDTANIAVNGYASANNTLQIATNDTLLTWNILGINNGNTVSSNFSVQFNNVQNLIGSTNTNNFIINADAQLAGTITGGPGSTTTINYQLLTNPTTINFSSGNAGTTMSDNILVNAFNNIKNLITNEANNNTLQLANQSNTLAFTAATKGRANTTSFSGFKTFISTSHNDLVAFNMPVTYSSINPGLVTVNNTQINFTNFDPSLFIPPPVAPQAKVEINSVIAQILSAPATLNSISPNYNLTLTRPGANSLELQGAIFRQIYDAPYQTSPGPFIINAPSPTAGEAMNTETSLALPITAPQENTAHNINITANDDINNQNEKIEEISLNNKKPQLQSPENILRKALNSPFQISARFLLKTE